MEVEQFRFSNRCLMSSYLGGYLRGELNFTVAFDSIDAVSKTRETNPSITNDHRGVGGGTQINWIYPSPHVSGHLSLCYHGDVRLC